MQEIVFSGRGGQGVVVASQMLGLAFFHAGYYPQCYSVFGGERRGAPVRSYLRVDEEKILLKCEIRHPQELVCLDPSLLEMEDSTSFMAPGGRVLLNSSQPPDAFKGRYGSEVAVIDAFSISRASGLGRIINTTVLGAYARLSRRISLEHVLEAISDLVPAKVEENMAAARLAYDSLAGPREGEPGPAEGETR